ncbi:uncharacterized protein LOC129613831 [Condylostylus longicornis]|uniref:uncharacterized protein LOC129613831 n=1 Tax=Condylostylus longicornis TaxID=2530218 RepID=UPI00244E46C6|nr:uncharacterized protein LOC129613831 [Condylostylus longicornis]
MINKFGKHFGLQICVIFTTLTIINITFAFENARKIDDDQPINICGKAIPETLALVCETLNSLPVLPTSKRSLYEGKQLFDFGYDNNMLNMDNVQFHNQINDNTQNNEIFDFNWKDAYKNLIYKPRSTRSYYLSQMYSRGIVRECCINSCSYKKLKSYCAKTRE